ncbi:MAG: hypothetical protein DWQ34_07270 [Planctomycetota bacterium]|nr:MAG: hypothetical protein DWQ29_16670 [Planctomycetota bacterium]REJ95002.1 MAG: hypothetical protein DWQ34_07270 [Planctomycetota bacterium]REK23429.1 MAG: hypothetical protein DWQ41_16900 [Planctomycetota bacterium]REK38934.1 MAG: hypothetical protein DWQ45_03570 [Planctomycetota bacterium]
MSRFARYHLSTACAVLALVAFGAQLSAQEEEAAPKVTFVDDVLPIFKARCGSCHNANDRKGGLALDSFATAMEGGSSGTVVEGGDPDASYLWLLVNHESEPAMPPNSDKLPENELAVIRNWISGGLLENSGSTAMIKKKTSVAKIEISTERPAEVALPQVYFGEPQIQTETTNSVTALATSPWAPIAAVSGYHQVALYNTATLEPLGVLPFPEGQPEIIKFSRNGSLLLVGGGRGGANGKVVLFDVKTGERVGEYGDEYDSVLAADISADHSQVALGGPKKMLRVYSVETGELQYEVKKHTDWICAIEFSPDGVLLASADRANGLHVWEAFTGRPFHTLNGHTGSVNDVSWRADSNVLASASSDNTIRLWEMTNGTQVRSWNAHGGAFAVEYIRDGRLVSTGRDLVVRLWNGEGAQIAEFPGLAEIGLEVAFDAETERALGGDWTGMVRVWNVADGAQVGQLDTNPPTLTSHIESLTQQVAAAEAQAAQTAAALAALQKAMADKQAAADKAVADANAAAETAKQTAAAKAAADQAVTDATAAKAAADKAAADAATAKTAADQDVAAKTEAVKAAGDDAEKLKAAQEALTASTTAQQQAAAALTAAQKAAEAATAALANAQKAATDAAAADKAAQESAATLKTAADTAVEAAKVTPEQQQALEAAQAAANTAQQNLATLKAALERANGHLANLQANAGS